MTTEPAHTDEPSESAGETRHRTAADHPGALRNETWLTIQTRQAQRLVHGRPAADGKPAIVGLTRFSTLVRQIWTGARAGDPFGDWWLLKIHDALEQSKRDVESVQRAAGARLESVAGVDVGMACSLEPVRIPLQFSHAYAFRGAYLLAAFDDAVRGLLTARHVGLMGRDESERLIADAARAVRRAFTSPAGYRFLGITRAEVRQGTARARQAADAMGTLPGEILEGKREAPYGPQAQGGFGALNTRRAARAGTDSDPASPSRTRDPDASP